MTNRPLAVVTGAFGYSGRRIASRLLDRGYRVRPLTSKRPAPDPFDGAVDVRPFDFDRLDRLETSLSGAAALINTYWVRFNHRDFTHEDAVRNTFAMFDAAQ